MKTGADAAQKQGFYQEKARVSKDLSTKASQQQLGKKKTGITAKYINEYVSSTGRSVDSLFGPVLAKFLRDNAVVKDARAQQSKQKSLITAQTAIKGQAPAAPQATAQKNPALEFVQNQLKKR